MSNPLNYYTCFFQEESIGIHVEQVLSKGDKLKKKSVYVIGMKILFYR